jgi:CRP-like cAMP-binding protein
MKKVIEFLEMINSSPFPNELKAYLYDVLQTQIIKKRVKVLRVGQVSDRIYFIESGLFRCYVMRGEDEICKWFMREGNIMISVNSFFNRKQSTETIEALEESEVHWITFDQLQKIYELFPEFRRIGQRLTEIYYCASEVRADDLRMKQADELYSDWITNQPELAGRVKKSYLASYFGITPPTLSRAKKTAKI